MRRTRPLQDSTHTNTAYTEQEYHTKVAFCDTETRAYGGTETSAQILAVAEAFLAVTSTFAFLSLQYWDLMDNRNQRTDYWNMKGAGEKFYKEDGVRCFNSC